MRQARHANLTPEALICHLCQTGLILLQKGFAPALKMAGAEAGGLQYEGHTAGRDTGVYGLSVRL